MEICPQCGSNKTQQDFEPDIGFWWTCLSCGHQWSIEGENRKEKPMNQCKQCRSTQVEMKWNTQGFTFRCLSCGTECAINDKETQQEIAVTLEIAIDGVSIMEQQLKTLGISDEDFKVFYQFRRQSDQLWSDAIEQSSGKANFVHAIRAYYAHLVEDFLRLTEAVK